MSKKITILRILLLLGAVFYCIGAVVHFFGLTVFPFYDAKLYSPYHDSLLAVVCVVFAMFFVVIARDPVKNKDTLKVVIVSVFLVSIFNIAILWKVDFAMLGAPAKKIQTLIEAGIGFIYAVLLTWYSRAY